MADEDSATDALADAIVMDWAADIIRRRNPQGYQADAMVHGVTNWLRYYARSLWQEANSSE